MAFTKVLLTQAVPHLGAEADIVRVRRGYARNFLLPQGKALEINAATLRQIHHLKARRAEREARELVAAEELAAKLGKLKLQFTLETGESGKAFGSITSKDIYDRLIQEIPGLALERHAIELEKPIKETGPREVRVRVHKDVTATLHLLVGTPEAPKPAADSDSSPKSGRKSARKKKTEAGG